MSNKPKKQDVEQAVVEDGVVYTCTDEGCFIKNPRTNEIMSDEDVIKIRKEIQKRIRDEEIKFEREEMERTGKISPSQTWSTNLIPWTIDKFSGSDNPDALTELVVRRSAKRWGYRLIDEEVYWRNNGRPPPQGPSTFWIKLRFADNSEFDTSGANGEMCIAGCKKGPSPNPRFAMRLNAGKTWDPDHLGSNLNMELTATHEFGHGWLHFVHTTCSNCIMNAGAGNHNIAVVLATGSDSDLSPITADGEPDNAKWIANTDGWKDRQEAFEALDLQTVYDDRLARLAAR